MKSLNVFIYIISTFCVLHAQSYQNKALFFVGTEFQNWANFPESAAQQVKDIQYELEANYGFKTELVNDASRKEILTKILDYQEKQYGNNDQLLIYFSLHGHYEDGSSAFPNTANGTLAKVVH